MRSAKQRISSALILAVGASMLMGCELPERNTQVKSIKIGVTLYDQYDAFLSELMEDFNTYAAAKEEETGIAINVEVYNASQSQTTQNNQVEAMAQDGCDIICVNLVDRTDPTTVIDLAEKNDIPVIFFNRELVEEDLERWDKLYYVGAKAFESGMMEGQIAAAAFLQDPSVDRNQDGVYQYVVLEGEPGHQDAIVRTEYSVNTIVSSGIEVEKLGYAIANWNRAQAQTRMMQLIGQYKTNIEMVIANSDSMALGAIDAYEKLGYTESNIPVFFGIDGTDEGLEAVQKGKIAATVYNDKEGQAKAMAELVIAAVTGKEMEDIQFENNRYIYLPYKKVTKENVETMIK